MRAKHLRMATAVGLLLRTGLNVAKSAAPLA
jgi:hypothetical protein